MAGDKPIAVKVSIDPFQEVDKKKWKQMEADVKGFKKPGRVDFSAKFSVTTAKWDKRKLEEQARAIFRYDLSLLASQIWQDFVLVEKATNERDKEKQKKVFLKAVPDLQKAMVKNLNQKFAEFQEDIASGAGDDLSELKRARKALNKETGFEIGYAAVEFREVFTNALFDVLQPLKKAETKSSGDEKAEATEALEKELKKEMPKMEQALAAMTKVFAKNLGALKAIPAVLTKGQKKDVSDALKAEYSNAAGELGKILKPIEKHSAAASKNAEAALKKVAGKELGKTTVDLGMGAVFKTIDAAGDLGHAISKINDKLKKLEQTVKKR